jgi:hypothetical protein
MRRKLNRWTHTHLGSIVTKDGGADEDVRSQIRKANGAFIELYPIRRN